MPPKPPQNSVFLHYSCRFNTAVHGTFKDQSRQGGWCLSPIQTQASPHTPIGVLTCKMFKTQRASVLLDKCLRWQNTEIDLSNGAQSTKKAIPPPCKREFSIFVSECGGWGLSFQPALQEETLLKPFCTCITEATR